MTKEHSGCSSSRLHVVGKTLKRCHTGYWGWCFCIFSNYQTLRNRRQWLQMSNASRAVYYISTFMSGTFINRFVSYLCENMRRLLSKHSAASCCLSQLFNTLWNPKNESSDGRSLPLEQNSFRMERPVCQAWLMPMSPSQKKNSALSKVSSFSIQA